jgi:hypothetical protein
MFNIWIILFSSDCMFWSMKIIIRWFMTAFVVTELSKWANFLHLQIFLNLLIYSRLCASWQEVRCLPWGAYEFCQWIDMHDGRLRLKWREVEGSCECGNKPSGSVKCWGNSWVVAQLATSQEGLISMHLVILFHSLLLALTFHIRINLLM